MQNPDFDDNIRYFLEELLRIREANSIIEDILSSESHLTTE